MLFYLDEEETKSQLNNKPEIKPEPEPESPSKIYTMTAYIDLDNSDPETCVTYADDALNMTPASNEWDEWFGIYPVMFKDGKEIKKINPNNYAEYIDGTPADIESGEEGDVMIAFPRMGLIINTEDNILTVSMTNNTNNNNFKYYAHKRGTQNKNKFYLGAYKGYILDNKLRSLSGKNPTSSRTISQFRTAAQANGTGYEQSAFYQLTFRQAMYILKYKNLNSQIAVGRGYVDTGALSTTYSATATGGTNTKGLNFGETTGQEQMKLFGLEDFWGNIFEYIDGYIADANRNILTSTDNFNDSGEGYESYESGITSNIQNYMSKPQGNTETGFLAKEVKGSNTTHFCDFATLYASCAMIYGGAWSYTNYAGAFQTYGQAKLSTQALDYGARLMYL